MNLAENFNRAAQNLDPVYPDTPMRALLPKKPPELKERKQVKTLEPEEHSIRPLNLDVYFSNNSK